MTRSAAIARFLAAAGRADQPWHVLAEDASFRRYLRLSGAPPAVLMDAPPQHEDVRPFLRIQAHLQRIGLSVPAVLAADPDQGFVLLEDLGDALFPAVMTADNTGALYDSAVDTLATLHAAEPPAGLPVWDAAAMRRATAATFLDWWWPVCFGEPPDETIRAEFHQAMGRMLAPLGDGPQGFVHRDFFAGNLFWLPRDGDRRVGIIDFQDAALGHPAYDLVSLVEDARRDLPDGLLERSVRRYLARRPTLDEAGFRNACAICAAQRHLRVAALWVRLARRDGKPDYLRHGARTWRLLGDALKAPAAEALLAFLDRYVPVERRGNPEEES